jgi:DNA mismatch repair protein MutL
VPSIRILPPELASQIAAGEVVERPSSAVKELVENALDAGATRCDVEIEGGGITRIAVSDDGAGMTQDDARLAVERHATSKLGSLAELGRVTTFGFRGEALPSIASVSRFLLRTRPRSSEAGVEVAIEGGTAASIKPAGVPVGTTIEVRDLFYNVPARRKFLRSSGTESGHVAEVVEAAALSRPDVTFTFSRDGRRVREWLRVADREERARQACPDDGLAACRGERGPLRVEAFLSRPERARSGAGGLRILVNDRPVRDRAVALTIAQAYGSVLERGRYPRGVLHLDLPPELVDVNVHPQKAEVRFADPRAVTDAVYGILSRALASAFSLPAPQRSGWGRSAPFPLEPTPAAASAPDPEPVGTDAWGLATRAETPATAPATEPELTPRVEAAPWLALHDSVASPIRPQPDVAWSSLRFIAQLRQTYLLCEGRDGIFVLDQHAAAERVTFTRLRRQFQSRSVASQAILFPVSFDIAVADATVIEERGDEMAAVGLDVRLAGPQTVSVHAVPKLLQRASPERLVRDLLSEVTRSGGRSFSNAVDLALATMACHGSIRAGDPLSATEAAALLAALDEADFAGHCPHGRPVVTYIGWAELERKVGRR